MLRDRERWTECKSCEGAIATPESDFCLRHLEPSQRRTALSAGKGHIDVRGVQVSKQVALDIVDAIARTPVKDHHILMNHAEFEHGLDLSPVGHIGNLSCVNTRFDGKFVARDITFEGTAAFRRAHFRSDALFGRARFLKGCTFRSADFLGAADFAAVKLVGAGMFEEALFAGHADFPNSNFQEVFFSYARFLAGSNFVELHARSSRWRKARFESQRPRSSVPHFQEAVMPRNSLPQDGHVRPRTRPVRVFLAAASESQRITDALEERLAREGAHVITWPYIFLPGQYTVDALLDQFRDSDFAVFVLAGEDELKLRGSAVLVPRDNVVFELGMSFGQLGPRRSFVLLPDDGTVHVLSDLKGITAVLYDEALSRTDPLAALSKAMGPIRRAIQREGARPGI